MFKIKVWNKHPFLPTAFNPVQLFNHRPPEVFFIRPASAINSTGSPAKRKSNAANAPQDKILIGARQNMFLEARVYSVQCTPFKFKRKKRRKITMGGNTFCFQQFLLFQTWKKLDKKRIIERGKSPLLSIHELNWS